jgi:hypothetical protein
VTPDLSDDALHSVAFDAFDLHWWDRSQHRCRACAGTRLHAIVRHRAHAILDALYGDRASVDDTLQIPTR